MSPAFAIARREMRSGIAHFRIFLACLALGVAAIAAVGSVRMAIQQGLSEQASTILGGDAQMEFTYRFANDVERDWMGRNAIDVSEIVDFRSMATVRSGTEAKRALTQVKGVDGAYPIYGAVILDPAIPLATALEARDAPGAVMDPVLIAQLGLSIGDRFTLGSKSFELRAALIREPDATGGGFGFGPRTIVSRAGLDGSGLVTTGTLFNSKYRLRLPETTDLTSARTDAMEQFRDTGMRWRDRRNGTPGTARFVERIGSFLVIVGLAGLAVGGIGVSAAVRSYLDRKSATIATLKTLGASGNTIFATYFIQIGTMAALGIAAGLALGAGVPLMLGPLLADRLPVPALFDVYARPLWEAALYGFLTAAIFAIWPLARARDIRAAGLFRDASAPVRQWPKPRYIALVLILTACLIITAATLSGIPRLAYWAAAGIGAALVALSLAATLTRRAAARAARGRIARGFSALRLALGSVGGPAGDTGAVVLSLGLGLTVLASVGQIDANMRAAIQNDLPEIAPSYFVVDIQNAQLEGFLDTTQATGDVSRIDTAPMLRGIITRINDVPAIDVAGQHWVLRGDRGVSYADAPPKGAEITEGVWWPDNYAGPPLVSFAAEEGAELGLKIGDQITINILGRDVKAEIANFRVVDFSNMGINFIMIMNPGALAGAPHSHIATVYAEESAEIPLLATMTDTYPNLTAIRVRDAIGRVTEAITALASATSWAAGATLLTGFVVLIGAAAAGERRRVFEAAVLKTLGASRARILSSFALRSIILGIAAGVIAIAAGGVAGWAVMTFVMEGDFSFHLRSALMIVGAGAMANLLAGLFFAWRPLAARPAQVLRARD